MIILHTSDWHLGKRLDEFSRIEEQNEVLQEICDIADNEKANVIIIAGDLFDTFNPPTEAVELFYKTLKKLSKNGNRAVIAIAGNHDSPERIEAPDPLARECGILFAGYPNSVISTLELESGLKVTKSDTGFIEVQLPDINESLRIILTPYANEFRLKTYIGHENSEAELRVLVEQKWNELAEKYCDEKGVNILATHLFVVKKGNLFPEEPDDEKPILHVGGAQAIYSENIPKQIQYVALGHLHRKQTVDTVPCPILYSGSPISYSFAEANQKKHVIVINANAGENVGIKEVELTKGKILLRKKADNIDDALVWLNENPNCLVELTIVSDTFLTAKERKLLNNAHHGIVTIIPEVKNSNELINSSKSSIDLSKNMESLFTEYFTYKNGQAPNERILNLFNEVLSEE
ncbi:MAG: exonuclease subunit SbcD [Bacteroidota bacterium]